MNGRIIQGDLIWQKSVLLLDFRAFGQAVKAKRTARKETREQACGAIGISDRFLANIENVGQSASVQVVFRLATRYEISMDQFFFPEKSEDKSATRQQIDFLLDQISEGGLGIVLSTAEGVLAFEKKAASEKEAT